jgi:nitrogen regulatory protein PII
MFFVLFVLNDITKCDDLLFGWENAGVKGITILASSGLGRVRQRLGLQEDFPIFPSLSEISEHSEQLSRTFFTVVSDEDLVNKIIENTHAVVGDLSNPNTGILIVLPVARVIGLNKNNNYD